MKQLIQGFLIFSLIIYPEYIHAQDTGTARKWSINECLQYAAGHNIEIITLRLNEQSAIEDLSAAKGVKTPNLYAAIDNTFNNANNDARGNGVLVNQLDNTGTYSLNSSIVLWNSGYINNNIIQRALQQRSAGLSADQSLNNITLQITQAYLNILLSKENLKYIADLAGTSEALVKQGQLFYDAGSVAKINLLQLQAQFASDRYLLVQAQNAIRQNTLLLKQLLQLPADTLFDIVTPASVEIIETLPSLQTVQQTAFQNFPEIKIGKLGIDIAALDIEKAKAGFKPTLSANGSLGSGYNDVMTNKVFPKTGYFTQSGNNFYQRIGVSLTVPILSNRINKTNVEKAQIGYRQANLNFQNYQLVLSQAVEQAYLNASNAIQSYSAAEEQLTAATESFRIIKEQFKLGGTNTFEVLQLRNQYVQAVQAYTQAKYTALLQYKIYEFYLGNPVTF
ncbi:MAG TPA: TolC family protein [Panacibacter sp.]|nr:TolC family protein [Panacibacter sp.]